MWQRKSNEWEQELADIRRDMALHEGASHHYMAKGSEILEFPQTAPAQFLTQNPAAQARLLKMLRSNCTFEREVFPLLGLSRSTCWREATKTEIGWVLGTEFATGCLQQPETPTRSTQTEAGIYSCWTARRLSEMCIQISDKRRALAEDRALAPGRDIRPPGRPARMRSFAISHQRYGGSGSAAHLSLTTTLPLARPVSR